MDGKSHADVLVEIPEKIQVVLNHLHQLMGTVQEGVVEVCVFLQQGNTKRGLQVLGEIIRALENVHGALDFLINVGYGKCLGLEDAKRNMEDIFPSLLASLEEHDFVALADILEYEFQPTLAACKDLINAKISYLS